MSFPHLLTDEDRQRSLAIRRARALPIPVRFWAKVDKSSECWEWTANITPSGYGQFTKTPGHPMRAHRVAWELTNGPIPAGMLVCHHCDNRRCVRPDHLFLGTNADNMADMAAKGRRARNAKVAPDDVHAIRASQESTAELAAIYGVRTSVIYAIREARTWRDLL